MAISQDEFFGFILPIIFGTMKGNNKKIIEFGNSTWGDCWDYECGKYGKIPSERPSDHPINFWRQQGADYLPVDINGINSYPHDLQKPVPKEILNTFDYLIDMGTIEHVKKQYPVWKNCHEVVKKDGYMLHSLPLIGWWQTHCYHWYTMDFFKNLAKACNYKLIMLSEEKACRPDFDNNPDYQILGCFKKQEQNEFISEEEFTKIWNDSGCKTDYEVVNSRPVHGIPNIKKLEEELGKLDV